MHAGETASRVSVVGVHESGPELPANDHMVPMTVPSKAAKVQAPEATPLGGFKLTEDDSRKFQKELRSMMYGFGDDEQPHAQSVRLMEQAVVSYMTDLMQVATNAAHERVSRSKRSTSHRVLDSDLLFVISKDARKHKRIRQVLQVWEEVKQANKETKEGLKELETAD